MAVLGNPMTVGKYFLCSIVGENTTTVRKINLNKVEGTIAASFNRKASPKSLLRRGL
jgi:hypothetical protein